MGCGCGGSTPVLGTQNGEQIAPRRVEGGPGQVGYTWNGPAIPTPPQAEPEPAAATAE